MMVMEKIIVTLVCTTIAALLVLGQEGPKASIARGKNIYEQYCLSCHQADGSGVPGMNPPLIKTSWVKGDKKKLIKWVLQGSAENVPIDGQSYSNNMAAQNFLKDQELADVLTYIRNSFDNKQSAVTATEVKTTRSTIK
jgi:mono/diheme cytochrome c family protein